MESLKDKNNLISSLARRKKLKEANKVFLSIKDIANHHSYSAILNAHVECGDIIGAQTIFNEILNDISKNKNKAGNKIRPDVITCTTMIKGYVSIFDLKSGLDLLNNMSTKFQPKVVPNIRTLNTLLRGCIFTGDAEAATELFLKIKSFEIELDSSFYEMYISILCQSLNLEVVFPMIGRIKDIYPASISLLHYHLGQALFLKGDFKKMNKVLSKASENIKNINNLQNEQEKNNSNVISNNSTSTSNATTTVGGKRSWSNVVDESRQESLQIFLNHKANELERNIDKLKSFKYKGSHKQVPILTFIISLLTSNDI